jgi:hypothetical protein
MTIFQAVTDDTLAAQIETVQRRVVFVDPGVTCRVVRALMSAYERKSVSVTVILDADEDAYRIGFGDPKALQELLAFAKKLEIPLRRQAGLRIGMVVVDDSVTIWSPTPKAVEAERKAEEPNGIVLQGEVAATLDTAVGGDGSTALAAKAEIGRQPLPVEELGKIAKGLQENPPAPFDLSQKTRVFSTKFQYVEPEVQGAHWTQRKVKISSLLLNADLPENIQEIVESQVSPYRAGSEIAIEVQSIVRGQLAYDSDGQPIFVPTRQADLDSAWDEITKRFLVYIKGFGWLIRKTDLAAFQSAVDGYETVLNDWVKQFREKMHQDEERIVENLVQAIQARAGQAPKRGKLDSIDLEGEVRKGLARMRIIEPKVRIVTKNVSWESTRDSEFTEALQAALPAEELEGWFEEFTAARQRGSDE